MRVTVPVKILAVLVLVAGALFSCGAQKDESVKEFLSRIGGKPGDTTLWNKITIEEVLGLPPVYKVEFCNLNYSNKGEIFKCYYGDKMRPPCVSWMLNLIASDTTRGASMYVDNILVKKGDRRIRLMTKAIAVK